MTRSLAALAAFSATALALAPMAWTPAAAMTAAPKAAAPKPVRPISSEVYSGRWYEIARTPNKVQKDCQGATSDFMGFDNGSFTVAETCHRGSPSGPARVIRAKAKVVAPGDNTRFRMSFFGGLIHQEYWVLDHADDNSWLLMATPGGNFVWLMSRRPSLPPSTLATALGRADALGYARARLMFPAPAAG